jgi:methanogenic corrinoid protein MtbC1
MVSEADVLHELVSAFVELDCSHVRELTKKALDSGIPANNVLKALQEGTLDVGKKYEEGEYFLSELMAAGEFFKVGLEELKPHLAKANTESVGTVVLGTVKGDLHDIGKNLFKTLLQSSAFTVNDLGVDVSPERFVDEIRRTKARILAMSSLLTTTMGQMQVVIEALKKAGLRDSVRVIIGGNPITEKFGQEIGADAAVKDAMQGARICVEWMKM